MRKFFTRAVALLALVGVVYCADDPTRMLSPLGGPNLAKVCNPAGKPKGCVPAPPDTTPTPPDTANQAPVANFTVACQGTVCTLDASNSTDDRGVASYNWNLGKAPDSLATGKIVSTDYWHSGSRTVVLTVADSAGLTNSLSKTFDVTGVVDTTTPPDTATPPDTSSTQSPPPSTNLGLGIATVAERPRVVPNYPYPTAQRIVRVPAGANLQTYLDAAQGGDLILLPPGATYVGNFVLPAVASASASAWIVLQTDASLIPAGTRMDPTRAASLNLAKIQTFNNTHALATAPGAHHWRLTQLDVGATAQSVDANGIIRLGENGTLAQASALVIDRSFVHGSSVQPVRRCVVLQSGAAVIIDSWFDRCHGSTGDTQTILGYNGTGPYLIQNNHLEGGTEVIMFGGADPATAGVIPSDITVVNNHITRDVADKGVWLVKNLFELKNAQRVLLANNLLENNWADGQVGYAVLVKSVNQQGGCTWCVSRDVTIIGNRIRNSGSGINLGGIQQGPAQPSVRITIQNNRVEQLGVAPFDGEGIPLMLLGNSLADVILSHNTVMPAPWGLAMFDGTPTQKLVFQDNALYCGGYGIKGSNYASGMSTLNYYAAGYGWAANALVGCSGGYPAGSTYFSSFPVAGTGTDGQPIGASF